MEIQNVTIEDAEELLDIYPYIKAVDNGQIVGYAYAGYCMPCTGKQVS